MTTHQTSLSSRLNNLSSLDPAQIHQAIIHSYHPESPLVTQEQQLNKYSAMVSDHAHLSHNFVSSIYPMMMERLIFLLKKDKIVRVVDKR